MARIDISFPSQSVRLAAHAIGLDNRNPYIRHGKKFYKPYRNYFTAVWNQPNAKEWAVLVTVGLAKMNRMENDHVIFWLTRKGLDWLGEEIGVKIHDEEE